MPTAAVSNGKKKNKHENVHCVQAESVIKMSFH